MEHKLKEKDGYTQITPSGGKKQQQEKEHQPLTLILSWQSL